MADSQVAVHKNSFLGHFKKDDAPAPDFHPIHQHAIDLSRWQKKQLNTRPTPQLAFQLPNRILAYPLIFS